VLLVTQIDWLADSIRKDGAKLGTVVMVETPQETATSLSRDRRYFIASRGVKAVSDFAKAVRAHGGLESMHWILDVTFREDACRVRKDPAARNLSLVRKISLAMLRLDIAYPKSSLRQRRNRACRKPLYREKLIGLRPRSQTSNKTQKK
jgi:predicted transposase YbfD/YdcC